MANPRIEVEIGAVIDGLKKGFGESVKIIDTLEKQAQELEKSLRDATDLGTIQKLNLDLAKTRSALSQLRTTGIDPLTKATSQYNSVGTDFARIIQDAPFGIIGVGNNITQLAGSFQTLKNQTGSTSQALKTAFASIFSSGNALILGISALTTVFTVLQMKGFFKTEEAAKSLSETLDEYREKLETIRRVSIEGQANASREIQNFNLLKAQAENANIPLQRRIEAVRDLQKTYPNYLGSLTQEQILTGNVGNAYKELASQLIATAKARAAADKIAKNSLDLLTLEEQQVDNVNKLIEKREKLIRLEQLASLQASKSRGEITGLDLQLFEIRKEIRDLELEQVKSVEERSKILQENLKLEESISTQISNGAVFTKSQLDATKEIKRTIQEILDIQTNRPPVSFAPTSPQAQGIGSENIQAQTNALLALEDALQGTGISIGQFYAAIANGAAEGFDSLDQFIFKLSETQQFIDNTFAILEQGIENTIGDVAFAIGDALASGADVSKAAGAALLSGIAGILNQLGQLAIGTGVAIEAIKKAFTSLGGVGAIVAGTALIALAGAVSNKARSLGGSMGRGGASSVGSSGVGGGSSFVGGAQGFGFNQNREIRGELVARGQDLVYVFNEANTRINKG